jgi:hypothetical protein
VKTFAESHLDRARVNINDSTTAVVWFVWNHHSNCNFRASFQCFTLVNVLCKLLAWLDVCHHDSMQLQQAANQYRNICYVRNRLRWRGHCRVEQDGQRRTLYTNCCATEEEAARAVDRWQVFMCQQLWIKLVISEQNKQFNLMPMDP